MNIIICGAGRVGFTIAKILGEQGHSITVIDQSSEDIQKIDDTLDVKAIVGKATYPSILEKANASEADMIIAVTRNDEINMLICQIAFSIFNVQKKIARIRSQDYLNPKFTKVYNKENLPIDVIISPEIEIAKSLQRKLEAPGALDNVPFAKNKIRLLEVLINENCPLIDIKLKDLTKKFPKLEANIMGVIRNEKFVVLKKDDKVYIAINASQMQDTLSAFGHNEKISNKILIIGGGNIGFNLAKNLEETFDSARVKIIEKDKERAEFIASELNNTIIINGNGLDEEVLIEANLDEVQTVLALTNDDEDNLMVSVLVEKFTKDKDDLNDKRTMALINKPNYSLLQSSLKIDDLIDPRMNTVSSILKHVHKGTIENAYSILNGEYEIIEAEIIETSELINKELKKSDLPEEIRIGAVLRGDEVIIPRSNFVFKKEDVVVLLAKKESLDVVENMFRISSI